MSWPRNQDQVVAKLCSVLSWDLETDFKGYMEV